MRKFRKLQRLAWAEQQAKHAATNDHSRHELINPVIDSPSSISSEATVILAVALLVTVCCYFKALTGRRQHRQLLETVSGRVARATHSRSGSRGFSLSLTLRGEEVLPSAEVPPALFNSSWLSTANGGWTSVPAPFPLLEPIQAGASSNSLSLSTPCCLPAPLLLLWHPRV